MSADLKYLAFTAILTASLWIPYVVCQVTTNGTPDASKLYRPHATPASVVGQARRSDIY